MSELIQAPAQPVAEAPVQPEDFSGLAASIMPGLFGGDAPTADALPDKPAGDQPPKEKVESKEKEPELKDLKKLYHNKLSELDSRENKFNAKLSKFKDQVALAAAAERSMAADIAVLTRGDGRQVLEVLSRLTKRDAGQLYEEMGLAILGKPRDPTKEIVEQLKAEIEELKAGTKEKDQAQEHSHTVGRVRAEIRQLANDSEQWPLIAAEVKQSPDKSIELLEDIYSNMSKEADAWLDTDVVFDRIERSLRKQARSGDAGAQKPAAGSGPGLEQGPRDESQNPATAQRPPTSSIPASIASTGSQREIDDDERLKDVVENYPGLWQELGL